MQKAFAYLRVSGSGQVEGDGFDRQLGAIKQYAGANDFKVARVFKEEGISGKTRDDGPTGLGSRRWQRSTRTESALSLSSG